MSDTYGPNHDMHCEAEFIAGPMLWTACGCASRATVRTDDDPDDCSDVWHLTLDATTDTCPTCGYGDQPEPLPPEAAAWLAGYRDGLTDTPDEPRSPR